MYSFLIMLKVYRMMAVMAETCSNQSLFMGKWNLLVKNPCISTVREMRNIKEHTSVG
jgi:hypothetical protein